MTNTAYNAGFGTIEVQGKSLRELYLFGQERMTQAGIENPRFETSLLLSRAFGISTIEAYAHPERAVKSEDVNTFTKLLERRVKREPIAYILGEKEFYSRPFIVTPDVLIPRPETEILVEEALKAVREIDNPHVLDVGTGSGCIAVTVGCECEHATISASDISLDALELARKNANRHGIGGKISFILADFLAGFKEASFDVVLTNPPYVAEKDFISLEPEIRDFEPKLALLGGKDGLDCIREIIFQAGSVLKKGGWCMIEVGVNQSERVFEIFEKHGFVELSSVRDLSGIERAVKGRWTR